MTHASRKYCMDNGHQELCREELQKTMEKVVLDLTTLIEKKFEDSVPSW